MYTKSENEQWLNEMVIATADVVRKNNEKFYFATFAAIAAGLACILTGWWQAICVAISVGSSLQFIYNTIITVANMRISTALDVELRKRKEYQ